MFITASAGPCKDAWSRLLLGRCSERLRIKREGSGSSEVQERQRGTWPCACTYPVSL